MADHDAPPQGASADRAASPRVFTVGHGARSIDDFVDVLGAADVDVVVDVRRFPGSRRHPHFARDALQASLPAADIAYEWHGDILGGRRKAVPDSPNVAWRNDSFRAYADHMASDEFRTALRELEERAQTTRQAVMCAETLWWRCHRRLIADALVVHGYDVVHLGTGRHDHHRLNASARLAHDGTLVYDVGVTQELDL